MEQWERDLEAAKRKQAGGTTSPAPAVLQDWSKQLESAIGQSSLTKAYGANVARSVAASAEDPGRPLTPEEQAFMTQKVPRSNPRGLTKDQQALARQQGKARIQREQGKEGNAVAHVVKGTLRAATMPLSTIAATTSLATAHKPITLGGVLGKAWNDQTSMGETVNNINPQGAGTAPNIVAGLALDVGLDPMMAYSYLGGGKRIAALAGKALEAAEGLPAVGRGIRGLTAEGRAMNAVAKGAEGEQAAVQRIVSVGGKVRGKVAQETRAIARDAGKVPVTDSAEPITTSLDRAAARSDYMRGKRAEEQAQAIQGRIQSQQRIKVGKRLPDATLGPGEIPEVRISDFGQLRKQMADLRRMRRAVESQNPEVLAEPYDALAAKMTEAADSLDASPRLGNLARRIQRETNAGRWNPKTNPTHRALQAEHNDAVETSGALRQNAQVMTQRAEAARNRTLPNDVGGTPLVPGEATRTVYSIDDQLGALEQRLGRLNEKYGQQVWAENTSEPLNVVKARSVAGRVTGRRAAAQTQYEALKGKVAREGRVELPRRGVAFQVLNPGDKVTPAYVRNLAGALADKTSLSGLALTPMDAEKELLQHAASMGIDTQRLQKVAFQARGIGKLYMKRLAGAGVSTPEALLDVERKGGYLRRMYGRDLLPSEHIQWLRDNGEPELAARMEWAQMNRPRIQTSGSAAPVHLLSERTPMTVQEQRARQMVTDVVARMEGGEYALSRVLPRMEMWQRFAKDPSLVSKTAKPGWLQIRPIDELEQIRKLQEAGAPYNVVQATEEAIREAHKQGGYGALAGMYVHPDLYYSLNPHRLDFRVSTLKEAKDQVVPWLRSMMVVPLDRPGPGSTAVQAYGWIQGEAKGLATVGNPLSQVANTLGNAVQAYVDGGTPLLAVPALQGYGIVSAAADTDWAYRVMKEMPSLAGHGSLQDLREMLFQVQQAHSKEPNAAQAAIRWLRERPGRVWELNEIGSKLGVVKYQMMRGASLEDAVTIAERALYNYGLVPRWVHVMRKLPIYPFITYPYKTAGLFGRALLHNPQRLNVLTRLGQAVESASPQNQRDAEAQLMPGYEGSNMDVRLPKKDQYGRSEYLRTGSYMPWGSIAGFDSPRNPLLIGPLIHAAQGQDEFGRDIYNSEASLKANMEAGGKYLGTSISPLYRLAQALQASTAAQKGKPGAVAPGKFPPQTVSELLGRVYPFDATKEVQRRLKDNLKSQQDLTRAGKDFAKKHGYVGKQGQPLPPEMWPDTERQKKVFLRERQRHVGEAQAVIEAYKAARESGAGNSRGKK
jgi:hypothetical protein